MSDAVEITDVTVQNFGSDICVSGHMKQKRRDKRCLQEL